MGKIIKRPLILVKVDCNGIKVLQYNSIYEAYHDGFHKRNLQRCLKGIYTHTDGYRVYERDYFMRKFGEFLSEI